MNAFAAQYGTVVIIIFGACVFGIAMYCYGVMHEREKRLRLAEEERQRQRAAELDRYAQESREFRLYSKRQFERESG